MRYALFHAAAASALVAAGSLLACLAVSSPMEPRSYIVQHFRVNCVMVDDDVDTTPVPGWAGPVAYKGYMCESGEILFVPKKEQPKKKPQKKKDTEVRWPGQAM